MLSFVDFLSTGHVEMGKNMALVRSLIIRSKHRGS